MQSNRHVVMQASRHEFRQAIKYRNIHTDLQVGTQVDKHSHVKSKPI